MYIHTNWDTPAFDLAPASARLGPFPGRGFLQAWWENCARPGEAVELVESDDGLLALRRGRHGVAFLGDEDLADYHAPLGDDAQVLVAQYMGDLPTGTAFRFDSLPGRSADVMAKGLADAGIPADTREHQAAMVMELPADYDTYLASLDRKERHETRRKRRRFEEILGPPVLTASDSIDEFVRLHRLSPGRKGEFMNEITESFFRALADLPGAVVHALQAGDGATVAAAFGFRADDGYYLYNSAYDPDAAQGSPGIVLLGMLLEDLMRDGVVAFDFLKGDETYKQRLGAQRRPLFVLEGVT